MKIKIKQHFYYKIKYNICQILFFKSIKINQFDFEEQKINDFVDEYKLQLKIYRLALEKSFKRKIDFSLIYFFDIDSVVYI